MKQQSLPNLFNNFEIIHRKTQSWQVILIYFLNEKLGTVENPV